MGDFDRRGRRGPFTLIVHVAAATVPPTSADSKSPPVRKAIYDYVSPGTALFMTRLSKSLHHYRRKSSKVEIEKQ